MKPKRTYTKKIPHTSEVKSPEIKTEEIHASKKMKKDFATDLHARLEKILLDHPSCRRKFSTDEQRLEYVAQFE